jgi:hypothetical protein
MLIPGPAPHETLHGNTCIQWSTRGITCHVWNYIWFHEDMVLVTSIDITCHPSNAVNTLCL